MKKLHFNYILKFPKILLGDNEVYEPSYSLSLKAGSGFSLEREVARHFLSVRNVHNIFNVNYKLKDEKNWKDTTIVVKFMPGFDPEDSIHISYKVVVNMDLVTLYFFELLEQEGIME